MFDKLPFRHTLHVAASGMSSEKRFESAEGGVLNR